MSLFNLYNYYTIINSFYVSILVLMDVPLQPNGIKLLENGIPIKTTTGNYYYDWQIQGITDRYNLIVVWRWDNNIKRVKFKAIPETEW